VPWVKVTAYPAEFWTIQTLLAVFGARVTVLSAVIDPVKVITIVLAASEVPSAIVIVCVVPVIASEPLPKASPINSRLVFVEVPHVPDSSPVAISFNLKLFT
jgi:hypothetical protein